MLINHLIKLGFNQGEAKIYNALLCSGPLTATELAQKTDLGRTNVYNYAKSLQERNIIGDYERNNKIYFQAADPRELYTMLDVQKKELNTLTLEHLNLLPRFTRLFKEQNKSPQIISFIGKVEWKRLMKKIYLENDLKEIFFLLPSLDDYTPPPPIYLTNFINRGTRTNIIVNHASELESFSKSDLKKNRRTILIDPRTYKIDCPMVVFKGNVMVGNFDAKELEVFSFENKAISGALSNLLRLVVLQRTDQ